MSKINLYSILLLSIILFATIHQVSAEPAFTLIYVAQQGDTLYEIARDYETDVETLLRINEINENERIRVGDELVIPHQQNNETKDDKHNFDKKLFSEKMEELDSDFSLERTTTYSVRINEEQTLPDVDFSPSELITYHVGVGDTLFDLARDFNTSTGVIMAINDMENSTIKKGDTLKLPVNNLTEQEVIARTIKPKEVELLARTIYAEARGEPYIGQVAVGAVVINRVLSNYFPDDFREVIYQGGQFTAVYDGQIKLNPNQTAYDAAREAINGKDPTQGALYYYNPETARNKSWFSSRELMVTIGDHVFAK